MGPDEPHEWVDDNRFTNAIARWNSEVALDALGWLWHSPPADEGEHARWQGMSRASTAPGNAGLRARSWQAIQEREEVKRPGY